MERQVGFIFLSLALVAPHAWVAPVSLSRSSPDTSAVFKNRGPLAPNAFYLLPLGSIKPGGWLRRQLEIQASGLTGHLDEFWPDLGPNSGWLGGTGESWERGPYYLDGLVPLAFLLEDPKLLAKVRKWAGWTLENQRPDGSIGPESNTDWWPNMIMLKALAQYHEATADARVISVMERYFRYQAGKLASHPLKDWAVYRWGDELLSVLWLYNRNGDRSLLDLARALHSQGYDWNRHFQNFEYKGKVGKEQAGMKTHVVNNAMALKSSAFWSLVSGERSDREAIYRQLRQLDRYHLLPNGVHSGDEHYAGTDPSQGTELCAVVEGMFSIEHLIAILGDPAFGDRLEKISFNALPGTFSADMWAHQYDQQPNQVLCTRQPRDWTTNGPESNLFGLEPNFGCCTSNMHQGWPKFAASLWMTTPDGGLAAVVYAPSTVKTAVRGGVPVTIAEETQYPFHEEIHFKINTGTAVKFPLRLRIPAWARSATVSINEGREEGAATGTFHTMEREWSEGDRVTLKLPMRVRASHWHRNSITLERGPLVFSLKIGEDWRKLRERAYDWRRHPSADWAVHPTTAWNYGLEVDTANPERSVQVTERIVGDNPFTPDAAPVELRVKGRRLPQWTVVNGSAGPLPWSPVESREPLETLILIPYGSAKLRVTAFPELAER